MKMFQGLTSETENFAFEIMFILGLECTPPDHYAAKTMLNGSTTNGFRFRRKCFTLNIVSNNIAFGVKVTLGLESTVWLAKWLK